jgi:hypothetical protein
MYDCDVGKGVGRGAGGVGCRVRRSLTSLVALAVIGGLLLPTVSNVAANALPDAWKPYLWLAWPAGVLLTVPMIYGEVRERRQLLGRQFGTVEDHQRRLDQAVHDLAEAVTRQWAKEAGLRSLLSPEPIRRVLPVLDGLDEMSAALQPVAINAIDLAVSDRFPLVTTCRSAEYREAVDRNGRFLAHAAVLEIQPVDIDDAASFLGGADPRPERWQPVLDRLHADPDGPLARALRSPLTIDLARTVYATPKGDPTELLDTTRFPRPARNRAPSV